MFDVGNEFYHRLRNRNTFQGDGKHNAVDFRKKYLNNMDVQDYWKNKSEPIILDFKNVEKIGPSFANEAFGYFTKYASPKEILKKINFVNITQVQFSIIMNELETCYKKT